MPNQLDEARYPNLASIETKKFRLGLKGYNVREVDQFLSALVSETAALQSTLEATESEVARLKGQASSQGDG
jgi:DivIVA domain-containing protein